MSRRPRVGIVGAGISGLSTAVSFQQAGTNADITILADRFSPDTTSDVAGGIWGPHAVGNTPEHLVKRWSDRTYWRYQKLFNSELCARTGLSRLSGYMLYKTTGNNLNPFWKDTVQNFQVMSSADLHNFPGMKEGYFYTTFTLETTDYLKWLMEQFTQHNGKTVKRKLSSLEEVAGDFDILVNCSGVRARQLVDDPHIDAVRGQVILLRAPWLKSFYISGSDDTYLLPRTKSVVLGGTHQEARWDDSPDEGDYKAILRRGYDLIPSLKGAEVVKTVAGLRPVRTEVRLERGADITSRGRNVPVIHNYGHGGSGYTLHVGCALDTVDLIKTAIDELVPKANL